MATNIVAVVVSDVNIGFTIGNAFYPINSCYVVPQIKTNFISLYLVSDFNQQSPVFSDSLANLQVNGTTYTDYVAAMVALRSQIVKQS